VLASQIQQFVTVFTIRLSLARIWRAFRIFFLEGVCLNIPLPPPICHCFTQYSRRQCSHITSQVQVFVTCSSCTTEASVPQTYVLTQRNRYTWQVMNFYVNMWWRILALCGMALTIACALVSGSLHSLRRTSWTVQCTSWHMWAN